MAGRGRNGRGRVPAPDQTFVEDDKGGPSFADGGAPEEEKPATNGRLDALNDLVEQWVREQNTEDALIEKYIKPVRDRKNELKQIAKRDYETPIEAFNARALNRRIELREDNDEVVLALRELYQATPVGKNIDMIAAAERVAAKRKAEAEAAAAVVAEKAARKSKIKEGKEAAL